MTAKRDLKRRVRQRQARTGEAYVTARRHVVAGRAASADASADADADAGADSEAVDPAGVTARGPAAAPSDAETASPEAHVEVDDGLNVHGHVNLNDGRQGQGPGRRQPGAAPEAGARAAAADAPATEASAPGATAPAVPAGPVAAVAGAVAAEIDADDTGPVRATAAPPAAVAPGRGETVVPTPAAPAPGNPAGAAMSVVELLDVSEQARRLGLVCRIAMFPGLAARVEPASVLARLRDLLIETADDPQFLLLSQVALTGRAPPRPPRPTLQSFEAVHRFFRRARAGIGGVSEDGTTLAFHVAGRDGLVPVGCALHWPGASLVLSGIDDLMSEVAGLRDWLTAEGRVGAGREVTDLLAMRLMPGAVRAAPNRFAPTLFVVHDGRRYPITQDEFLIGRSRGTVHLTIRDGMVSRHHAAVIRRHGVHYLKDLGSTHGITYKGMRIDNKRIEEGDVFQLGEHELTFTFQDA